MERAQVAATLRSAVVAVEEAEVPAELREVAFEKAVDLLEQREAPADAVERIEALPPDNDRI